MFTKCSFLVFVLALSPIVNAVDNSNTTRKYQPFSYAVYKPGMSFQSDGALELWFKTEMKDAMILYEDTVGQGEFLEFLDVFLVNGKARMRLAFADCSFKERIINGSFNDRKWHKVKISLYKGNITLSVDNQSANPVKCSKQVNSMEALYAGYLSSEVRASEAHWAFPSSYWESMQSSFQGCLCEIKYLIEGKVTSPRLRTTKYTRPGCTNPCAKFTCKHGGKCVDRILKPWCNCEGTGHEGKRCGRALRKIITKFSTSSTTWATKLSTKPTTAKPVTSNRPPKMNAKAQKKASGNFHGSTQRVVVMTTILTVVLSLFL